MIKFTAAITHILTLIGVTGWILDKGHLSHAGLIVCFILLLSAVSGLWVLAVKGDIPLWLGLEIEARKARLRQRIREAEKGA